MIPQELSQRKNVSAALGGVWGSSTEAPELSGQSVFRGTPKILRTSKNYMQ